MEDIVLVGFGGHGKSVADCIERQGEYNIIGYTDLKPYNNCKYKYLGTDEILEELFKRGIKNAFICIGYLGKGNIRKKIYDYLKKIGYTLPIIIDPSAIVSKSAELGEGVFVGKMAVINAEAKVGKMAIINTKSLVEHECSIGEFTHIAVGAVLCGTVSIGKMSFVGANATIIQSIQIGNYTIVGAGAIITKNIFDDVVVYNKTVNISKDNR